MSQGDVIAEASRRAEAHLGTAGDRARAAIEHGADAAVDHARRTRGHVLEGLEAQANARAAQLEADVERAASAVRAVARTAHQTIDQRATGQAEALRDPPLEAVELAGQAAEARVQVASEAGRRALAERAAHRAQEIDQRQQAAASRIEAAAQGGDEHLRAAEQAAQAGVEAATEAHVAELGRAADAAEHALRTATAEAETAVDAASTRGEARLTAEAAAGRAQIEQATDQAEQTVAQRAAAHAESLQQTAAQVIESLVRRGETAVAAVDAAATNEQESLGPVADAAREALAAGRDEAVERVATAEQSHTDALKSATDAVLAKLKASGDQATEAIEQASADAAGRVVSAGDAAAQTLGQRAEQTAQRLQTEAARQRADLAASAARDGARVQTAASTGVGHVQAALTAASAALDAAVDAAREALEAAADQGQQLMATQFESAADKVEAALDHGLQALDGAARDGLVRIESTLQAEREALVQRAEALSRTLRQHVQRAVVEVSSRTLARVEALRDTTHQRCDQVIARGRQAAANVEQAARGRLDHLTELSGAALGDLRSLVADAQSRIVTVIQQGADRLAAATATAVEQVMAQLEDARGRLESAHRRALATIEDAHQSGEGKLGDAAGESAYADRPRLPDADAPRFAVDELDGLRTPSPWDPNFAPDEPADFATGELDDGPDVIAAANSLFEGALDVANGFARSVTVVGDVASAVDFAAFAMRARAAAHHLMGDSERGAHWDGRAEHLEGMAVEAGGRAAANAAGLFGADETERSRWREVGRSTVIALDLRHTLRAVMNGGYSQVVRGVGDVADGAATGIGLARSASDLGEHLAGVVLPPTR